MAVTARAKMVWPQSAKALILATERMVAHEGVGISLRRIIEAAGVRNATAVQYHFGSREGLLAAVTAHRLAEVNILRHAALESLAQEDRLGDVRALAGVAIYSLAAQVEPRAEGNTYLRFLERCVREYGQQLPGGEPGSETISGQMAIDGHLRPLLSHLPEEIIDVRLLIAQAQGLYGLAAIEARLEREPGLRDRLPLQVEILIDAIAPMLQAPISPQTRALLAANRPI